MSKALPEVDLQKVLNEAISMANISYLGPDSEDDREWLSSERHDECLGTKYPTLTAYLRDQSSSEPKAQETP